MSQWGADPIRDNISEAARPGWKFGAERFHYDCDTLAQMLVKGLPMLLPGEDDGIEAKVLSAATLALRTVDVLTFAPNYNPEQDAWWVDVDIDAGTAAAPFVRLGLVRYQQHAKQAIEAADDKRLSLPHMVEFVLEPKRTVTVIAEPKLKHDDSWPVRVIVRGPAGVVRGGGDALPEATLAERLSRQTRPYFKLTVLRGDADGSGEQAVAEVTSENSPPPAGDILWETVVYLRARPTGSPHYIFVEERDLMLSANQVSPDLVLSGPRFMAKVPITKRRKPRPTH